MPPGLPSWRTRWSRSVIMQVTPRWVQIIHSRRLLEALCIIPVCANKKTKTKNACERKQLKWLPPAPPISMLKTMTVMECKWCAKKSLSMWNQWDRALCQHWNWGSGGGTLTTPQENVDRLFFCTHRYHYIRRLDVQTHITAVILSSCWQTAPLYCSKDGHTHGWACARTSEPMDECKYGQTNE